MRLCCNFNIVMRRQKSGPIYRSFIFSLPTIASPRFGNEIIRLFSLISWSLTSSKKVPNTCKRISLSGSSVIDSAAGRRSFGLTHLKIGYKLDNLLLYLLHSSKQAWVVQELHSDGAATDEMWVLNAQPQLLQQSAFANFRSRHEWTCSRSYSHQGNRL